MVAPSVKQIHERVGGVVAGWGLDEECVRVFSKNLVRQLQHSSNQEFELEEVLHYLQPTHVVQNQIPQCPELEYLQRTYTPAPGASQPIQTSDVTYGEKVVSDPCRFCGRTNVTFMPLQTRSADEPTSYYYTCGDCRKSWKSR